MSIASEKTKEAILRSISTGSSHIWEITNDTKLNNATVQIRLRELLDDKKLVRVTRGVYQLQLGVKVAPEKKNIWNWMKVFIP